MPERSSDLGEALRPSAGGFLDCRENSPPKSRRSSARPEPVRKVRVEPSRPKTKRTCSISSATFESNPDRFFFHDTAWRRSLWQAIQHDPSFALAHARLAATLARIYQWFDTTTTESADQDRGGNRRGAASRYGRRAFRARPLLLLCRKGYEKALEEFATAGAALPTTARWLFRGAIRRRQGRWTENIELLKKCQALDRGMQTRP